MSSSSLFRLKLSLIFVIFTRRMKEIQNPPHNPKDYTGQTKLKTQNLSARPPIVAVMGHVDHGKTTLLDYIRKTNVASKEAGGITQSIGAYEIEHLLTSSGQVKKITFVDTPGHESFSKMRMRGVKVADLAILVVAADDGVKPQTKETIQILKSTNTPFVVAINKIDKSNADIERTKSDLMKEEVLLEGYGGNISWQGISAKTGQGVNELLDLILLAAELEDLKYDSSASASGVIIESKMDSRKGIVVSVIVKNGNLKVGEEIYTSSAKGKIKLIEKFLNKKVDSFLPSSPALIIGFEELPQIGEEFFAGRKDIYERGKTAIKKPIKNLSEENGVPVLNLIIKADVSGSLEAISGIIKNLPQENAKINIVDELIGDINDNDVKLAIATKGIIVGFKSKAVKSAENLAGINNIKIITSEIIYKLLEFLEEEIKIGGKQHPSGELEILAVFSGKNKKQIVGGRVFSGSVRNKSHFKIIRNNEEISRGKILNLQKSKKDIDNVDINEECGIFVEADRPIEKGDKLVFYNK